MGNLCATRALVAERLSSEGNSCSEDRGRRARLQFPCHYVDYRKAQGNTWWVSNINGSPPLTLPFYVFRQQTSSSDIFEVRYWMRADTGFPFDIQARRRYGVNSRSGLAWTRPSSLCDVTARRGNC